MKSLMPGFVYRVLLNMEAEIAKVIGRTDYFKKGKSDERYYYMDTDKCCGKLNYCSDIGSAI